MSKTKTPPKKAPATPAEDPKKGVKKEKPAERGDAPDASLDSILKSQEGLLYRGRSHKADEAYDVIPFGLYAIDQMVLGVGGAIRGRVYEVVGNNSSGKTTLCLHLIAQAQKMGLQVAYIDAEHALDETWARQRGVDVDELIIGKPEWGEQAMNQVDAMCSTFQVGLIVIDSVAALVPKKELDGEVGDAQMGSHARLMSQALRKLVGIVEKSNTCVVFTNQYRKGMASSFGPENVPTGGNALKFYASVRLELANVGKITVGSGDDADVVGNNIKVQSVKNKTYRPWRHVVIPLLHDRGFDDVGAMFDYAEKQGLPGIEKVSTVMWSIFGQSARGRAAALEVARQHEDELRQELLKYHSGGLQS